MKEFLRLKKRIKSNNCWWREYNNEELNVGKIVEHEYFHFYQNLRGLRKNRNKIDS